MDAKKKDKCNPLTEQSEKPKQRYPEMDERNFKLMTIDGPDSETPSNKSQDAFIEPQSEVKDSLTSKKPVETVEKEEVRELDICFRGEPGMIITRVRTEATKRYRGRLLK